MGSKIPRPARRVLHDVVECANERGMVLDGGMSKGHNRTFLGKGSLCVRTEEINGGWAVTFKFCDKNVLHELTVDSTEHEPVAVANSVLDFLDPTRNTEEALTELRTYVAGAASSVHPKVRYVAACSHLATTETLLRLAGDSVPAVRKAVVENVNTPNNVRLLATTALAQTD